MVIKTIADNCPGFIDFHTAVRIVLEKFEKHSDRYTKQIAGVQYIDALKVFASIPNFDKSLTDNDLKIINRMVNLVGSPLEVSNDLSLLLSNIF